MRPGPPSRPIGFATNLTFQSALILDSRLKSCVDLPFVITLSNHHNRLSLVCIQLIRSFRLEVVLDYSVYPSSVSYGAIGHCPGETYGCLFFGSAAELTGVALTGGDGPGCGRVFGAGYGF